MDGLLAFSFVRRGKEDGTWDEERWEKQEKNISKFILKSKNPSIQFRALMAFYLGGLLIMDDIIVIIN